MKTRQLIGAWGVLIITALFLMTPPPGAGAQSAPKGEFKRTVEKYTVPDVTLLNQDGQKFNLRSILDPEKPVIIDFIYTTCTTICPVLSANFLNLQNRLGDATATVQLVSISIDPENDRPEQMKKYMQMFKAREGWNFLTGSRDEIIIVLKAFNATLIDKMSHTPLYLLHGPKSDEWVRIHGMIGSADLLNEVRSLQK